MHHSSDPFGRNEIPIIPEIHTWQIPDLKNPKFQ